MPLTITEALAEIKTIGKRLTKKREFAAQYLVRQEQFKDPLAGEGGSRVAIVAARHSIRDLEERVVAIRSAIQRVNQATTITVLGVTRTIADWLVWRREVSAGQRAFLTQLQTGLKNVRAEAVKKGLAVRADDTPAAATDILVNIDELALASDSERLEELLGTLDGQLSLKNATTLVDL